MAEEKGKAAMTPQELLKTEKQITIILDKIREEVHSLNVEWLQLRTLIKKTENLTLSEENNVTINFDDVTAINSESCNIEPLKIDLNQDDNSTEDESDPDELNESFE